MEMKNMLTIQLGTRRLQHVQGAFLMNIPMIAVRTLGLQAGDNMAVSIAEDGVLRIKKEESALPDMNPARPDPAVLQTDPKRRAANECIG